MVIATLEYDRFQPRPNVDFSLGEACKTLTIDAFSSVGASMLMGLFMPISRQATVGLLIVMWSTQAFIAIVAVMWQISKMSVAEGATEGRG